MGQKQKKITEIATGLGRRTREEIYIEKWDQTGSPEIPDRVETEILWPPFGDQLKYSSPNRSTTTKDKSHTKEPTFWEMEV